MASVMVLDIGHCPDDFKGFEYFFTHVALDLHFNVYFIQTTVEWLFIISQVLHSDSKCENTYLHEVII